MGKNKRNRNAKNNVKQEVMEINQSKQNYIQKHEKGLNFVISIITIIISLCALMISGVSLVSNNHILTPKFSLEVKKTNESDSENLNRVFKIYNAGGQIVNPQISPVIQLELYCASLDKKGLPDREGVVLVGLSDYFSEDYSFNNVESAFIIKETKANEVYKLIENIDNTLRKNKKCINLFSIKYYFDISYYDYKGKKESKIFCPLNNYAAIIYKNSKKERYFRNNELVEDGDIRQEDIMIPLDSEDILTYSQYKGFFDLPSMKEDTKTYELLSSYIKSYLNKYSEKLYINEKTGWRQSTKSKTTDFIKDDKELLIGLILKHKNTYKTSMFWLLTLILIFSCILIFYLVKRIKRKK